jgi:hypothetical protein
MTALAERETPTTNTTRPLLLAFLGILVISLPIIGHGCHAGDHDDELSVPAEEKISHR